MTQRAGRALHTPLLVQLHVCTCYRLICTLSILVSHPVWSAILSKRVSSRDPNTDLELTLYGLK